MKTITRSELYELIWATPASRLSAALGISDVMIKRHCKRLNIPAPGRGYWMRPGNRVPLPPGDNSELTITPAGRWKHRGRRLIAHDGPNRLAAGPLADDLESLRTSYPRLWVAFHVEIGTQLNAVALAKLDWQHIGADWTISGPLGRGGRMISAGVADYSARALEPFRKASGPVLKNPAYDRRRIAWLVGSEDWRKRILELRWSVGAPPVQTTHRFAVK